MLSGLNSVNSLEIYRTRVSRSFLALAKGRIENSRTRTTRGRTLSGQNGDDAKKYQEEQVKRAIEDVER